MFGEYSEQLSLTSALTSFHISPTIDRYHRIQDLFGSGEFYDTDSADSISSDDTIILDPSGNVAANLQPRRRKDGSVKKYRSAAAIAVEQTGQGHHGAVDSPPGGSDVEDHGGNEVRSSFSCMSFDNEQEDGEERTAVKHTCSMRNLYPSSEDHVGEKHSNICVEDGQDSSNGRETSEDSLMSEQNSQESLKGAESYEALYHNVVPNFFPCSYLQEAESCSTQAGNLPSDLSHSGSGQSNQPNLNTVTPAEQSIQPHVATTESGVSEPSKTSATLSSQSQIETLVQHEGVGFPPINPSGEVQNHISENFNTNNSNSNFGRDMSSPDMSSPGMPDLSPRYTSLACKTGLLSPPITPSLSPGGVAPCDRSTPTLSPEETSTEATDKRFVVGSSNAHDSEETALECSRTSSNSSSGQQGEMWADNIIIGENDVNTKRYAERAYQTVEIDGDFAKDPSGNGVDSADTEMFCIASGKIRHSSGLVEGTGINCGEKIIGRLVGASPDVVGGCIDTVSAANDLSEKVCYSAPKDGISNKALCGDIVASNDKTDRGARQRIGGENVEVSEIKCGSTDSEAFLYGTSVEESAPSTKEGISDIDNSVNNVVNGMVDIVSNAGDIDQSCGERVNKSSQSSLASNSGVALQAAPSEQIEADKTCEQLGDSVSDDGPYSPSMLNETVFETNSERHDAVKYLNNIRVNYPHVEIEKFLNMKSCLDWIKYFLLQDASKLSKNIEELADVSSTLSATTRTVHCDDVEVVEESTVSKNAQPQGGLVPYSDDEGDTSEDEIMLLEVPSDGNLEVSQKENPCPAQMTDSEVLKAGNAQSCVPTSTVNLVGYSSHEYSSGAEFTENEEDSQTPFKTQPLMDPNNKTGTADLVEPQSISSTYKVDEHQEDNQMISELSVAPENTFLPVNSVNKDVDSQNMRRLICEDDVRTLEHWDVKPCLASEPGLVRPASEDVFNQESIDDGSVSCADETAIDKNEEHLCTSEGTIYETTESTSNTLQDDCISDIPISENQIERVDGISTLGKDSVLTIEESNQLHNTSNGNDSDSEESPPIQLSLDTIATAGNESTALSALQNLVSDIVTEQVSNIEHNNSPLVLNCPPFEILHTITTSLVSLITEWCDGAFDVNTEWSDLQLLCLQYLKKNNIWYDSVRHVLVDMRGSGPTVRVVQFKLPETEESSPESDTDTDFYYDSDIYSDDDTEITQEDDDDPDVVYSSIDANPEVSSDVDGETSTSVTPMVEKPKSQRSMTAIVFMISSDEDATNLNRTIKSQFLPTGGETGLPLSRFLTGAEQRDISPTSGAKVFTVRNIRPNQMQSALKAIADDYQKDKQETKTTESGDHEFQFSTEDTTPSRKLYKGAKASTSEGNTNDSEVEAESDAPVIKSYKLSDLFKKKIKVPSKDPPGSYNYDKLRKPRPKGGRSRKVALQRQHSETADDEETIDNLSNSQAVAVKVSSESNDEDSLPLSMMMSEDRKSRESSINKDGEPTKVVRPGDREQTRTTVEDGDSPGTSPNQKSPTEYQKKTYRNYRTAARSYRLKLKEKAKATLRKNKPGDTSSPSHQSKGLQKKAVMTDQPYVSPFHYYKTLRIKTLHKQGKSYILSDVARKWATMERHQKDILKNTWKRLVEEWVKGHPDDPRSAQLNAEMKSQLAATTASDPVINMMQNGKEVTPPPTQRQAMDFLEDVPLATISQMIIPKPVTDISDNIESMNQDVQSEEISLAVLSEDSTVATDIQTSAGVDSGKSNSIPLRQGLFDIVKPISDLDGDVGNTQNVVKSIDSDFVKQLKTVVSKSGVCNGLSEQPKSSDRGDKSSQSKDLQRKTDLGKTKMLKRKKSDSGERGGKTLSKDGVTVKKPRGRPRVIKREDCASQEEYEQKVLERRKRLQRELGERRKLLGHEQNVKKEDKAGKKEDIQGKQNKIEKIQDKQNKEGGKDKQKKRDESKDQQNGRKLQNKVDEEVNQVVMEGWIHKQIYTKRVKLRPEDFATPEEYAQKMSDRKKQLNKAARARRLLRDQKLSATVEKEDKVGSKSEESKEKQKKRDASGDKQNRRDASKDKQNKRDESKHKQNRLEEPKKVDEKVNQIVINGEVVPIPKRFKLRPEDCATPEEYAQKLLDRRERKRQQDRAYSARKKLLKEQKLSATIEKQDQAECNSVENKDKLIKVEVKGVQNNEEVSQVAIVAEATDKKVNETERKVFKHENLPDNSSKISSDEINLEGVSKRKVVGMKKVKRSDSSRVYNKWNLSDQCNRKASDKKRSPGENRERSRKQRENSDGKKKQHVRTPPMLARLATDSNFGNGDSTPTSVRRRVQSLPNIDIKDLENASRSSQSEASSAKRPKADVKQKSQSSTKPEKQNYSVTKDKYLKAVRSESDSDDLSPTKNNQPDPIRTLDLPPTKNNQPDPIRTLFAYGMTKGEQKKEPGETILVRKEIAKNTYSKKTCPGCSQLFLPHRYKQHRTECKGFHKTKSNRLEGKRTNDLMSNTHATKTRDCDSGGQPEWILEAEKVKSSSPVVFIDSDDEIPVVHSKLKRPFSSDDENEFSTPKIIRQCSIRLDIDEEFENLAKSLSESDSEAKKSSTSKTGKLPSDENVSNVKSRPSSLSSSGPPSPKGAFESAFLNFCNTNTYSGIQVTQKSSRGQRSFHPILDTVVHKKSQVKESAWTSSPKGEKSANQKSAEIKQLIDRKNLNEVKGRQSPSVPNTNYNDAFLNFTIATAERLDSSSKRSADTKNDITSPLKKNKPETNSSNDMNIAERPATPKLTPSESRTARELKRLNASEYATSVCPSVQTRNNLRCNLCGMKCASTRTLKSHRSRCKANS